MYTIYIYICVCSRVYAYMCAHICINSIWDTGACVRKHVYSIKLYAHIFITMGFSKNPLGESDRVPNKHINGFRGASIDDIQDH